MPMYVSPPDIVESIQMSTRLASFPLGNADSTRLTLNDGRRMLSTISGGETYIGTKREHIKVLLMIILNGDFHSEPRWNRILQFLAETLDPRGL